MRKRQKSFTCAASHGGRDSQFDGSVKTDPFRTKVHRSGHILGTDAQLAMNLAYFCKTECRAKEGDTQQILVGALRRSILDQRESIRKNRMVSKTTKKGSRQGDPSNKLSFVTHTMADTPLQYLSHMLLKRGWPPKSQSLIVTFPFVTFLILNPTCSHRGKCVSTG